MLWRIPLAGVDPVEVTITGIAAIGVVLLGQTYIVELPRDFHVTGEEYPYTHTAAFECHLEEL
jgi:hypothetical protein